MDNSEKKTWLLNEIAIALVTEPLSEYIKFVCPWNATYRVGWDTEHLTRFKDKVSRCYGFRNHRGGDNRRGVK